ncbi:MAG: protein translocase subunit SecD [Desulfobacterales bacterium]|nr:protein translocase subunit SecD [Desulfobacterales bacterium]
MNNQSWKLLTVVTAIIAAIILFLPTIVKHVNKTETPEMWPNKEVNLGLDLQGGMHMVLEVKTEEAVQQSIQTLSYELKSSARKDRIRVLSAKSYDKNYSQLLVTVPNDFKDKFRAFVDKSFGNLNIVSENLSGVTTQFILEYVAQEAAEIKKLAVDQVLEKIRKRIDSTGVREPDIRPQGKNRILIQLPGIKDPERAKKLLVKVARLEFKLVDDRPAVQPLPPGTQILYEHRADKEGNITKIPLLIKKRTLLSGNSLTDAKVSVGRDGDREVSIKFDRRGARTFERITGANINKRLAIILDDQVYSAPTINTKISGGQAVITGNFNTKEARDLVIVLRAGALPASVEIIEERTVGPTLGRDSIEMGLTSMVFGFLLVVLFMLIYYRVAGLIANMALFLNILFIGGSLAAFGATLTLPGIAGIILTIGMAVDANVLIFERIREELKQGQTVMAAVAAGFEKATLTILDANVTTLIAALILFQFGTGPIKGFAVTLSIGVLSSMFTALIASRLVFDFYVKKRRPETLKFFQIVKTGINVNFLKRVKFTFLISTSLIVICIVSLVAHKGPRLGIDFSSGLLTQVKFDGKVTSKSIQDGFKKININKVTVQEFGETGNNEYIVQVSNEEMKGKKISDEMKRKALEESTGKKAEVRLSKMIGPKVGKDLREKALFAMFYAILFITIYISGRFELKWMISGIMAGSLMFSVYILTSLGVSIPYLIAAALLVTIVLFWFLKLRYAMGAIIALIHDVAVTVGVFSLLELEFSLATIAALLTIIGYSLNDTIIVFDRIRENVKDNKKTTFKENINRSINETLSRTLLTSLTTLVVIVVLYLFGGPNIHDFAFALLIGVVIGTFSSIFVASPILLLWKDKVAEE